MKDEWVDEDGEAFSRVTSVRHRSFWYRVRKFFGVPLRAMIA